MITKWGVNNFKSISKKTELDIAPLTIFAGENSSGKSTFIQSILLVAQTLSHSVDLRSVVLNGSLISLGQFDDLRTNDAEKSQIEINFSCEPIHEEESDYPRRHGMPYYRAYLNYIKNIDCSFSFDAESSVSQRDVLQIRPRLFSANLSCVERDEAQAASISIERDKEAVEKYEKEYGTLESGDNLNVGLTYNINIDSASLMEIREDSFRSAVPVGCTLRHFLPDRIICKTDAVAENAHTVFFMLTVGMRSSIRHQRMRRNIILKKEVIAVLKEILQNEIDFEKLIAGKDEQQRLPEFEIEDMTIQSWYNKVTALPNAEKRTIRRLLNECNDLEKRIHNAMKAAVKRDKSFLKQLEPFGLSPSRPPRLIVDSSQYLVSFFSSSLKYLGPLRDEPKALYPIVQTTKPEDIGLRGEYTASILDQYREKIVQYVPAENFQKSGVNKKISRSTLEFAVTDWLKYLEVANSVKSKDMGKLGHELTVKIPNSEKMHDLTHVGVGVSQILPILVMCLISKKDSTLVFEQPELHLHPGVQSRLGDFFFSMALSNRQCIVETHSEYLINRLRYRIAESSKEDNFSDRVKIYFVKKSSESSQFNPVSINEYGAIMDWPEGFFDESEKQVENILRAAANKRKNEETGR